MIKRLSLNEMNSVGGGYQTPNDVLNSAGGKKYCGMAWSICGYDKTNEQEYLWYMVEKNLMLYRHCNTPADCSSEEYTECNSSTLGRIKKEYICE
jgi:hypothetical protein